MTKRQRIEEALAKNYEFRFNVLTGSIEYRLKKGGTFKLQTDYIMNSIIREIDKEYGENVSVQMYMSIVMSDFAERFHPVENYFRVDLAKLDAIEGTKNIEAMAATVTVPNPEAWLLSLKRWFVASVANGLTPKGCQNHNCIVLTGGMGLFKTTWLMNLSPPPLSPDMAFTGKIDLNLSNKDTFILLGTKFIINLDDQLRNLMKKDGETMKTLITHPEVSIRRAFAKFAETLARIGNFLASINGEEFLGENENRRFLPFRVKAIDINGAQKMNLDLVWKEALQIYTEGLYWKAKAEKGDAEAAEKFDKEFRYWWTKDELEHHFPDMNSFAYATDELEMITSHFEIPDHRDKANCLMNATDLLTYFKQKTGVILSTKKIGEAMKSLGAIQVKKRQNGTVLTKYAVIDPTQTVKPANLMENAEKEKSEFKKPQMQL